MVDLIRSLMILLLMIPGYIMFAFVYIVIFPICMFFKLKPDFKYSIEKE